MVDLFRRYGGLESPCNWPFQSVICAFQIKCIDLQLTTDFIQFAKRMDELVKPKDINLENLLLTVQTEVMIVSNLCRTCHISKQK